MTLTSNKSAQRSDGGIAAWGVTAIAFCSAFFAWGTMFYGHSFYMAALQQQHGWSASLISSAILGFYFAGIASTLFIGFVLDRHQPYLVFIWGGLSIGAGLMLLGYLQAPWQLYFVFVLMGTGYPALATAAISATLARWFDGRYGLALSLALSGASAGGAVMPPLMVHMSERLGFGTTTTMIGIATVATILPLALLLRHLGKSNNTPPNSAAGADVAFGYRAVLGTSRFWIVTIAASLALCSQVGFLAHQIPLLSGDVGAQLAALMVSATAISAFFGRLVVGAASSHFPLRAVAVACYLCQAAGFALLVFAEGVILQFAGCALVGFVVGAIVMLPPLLLRDVFGLDGFARIYGLCNVGLYIGAGLGPVLVGLLKDWQGSYTIALWLLVLFHIAAGIVICFSYQQGSKVRS